MVDRDEIDRLSVDPKAQRRGIGSWLLQKAEDKVSNLPKGQVRATYASDVANFVASTNLSLY